MTMHWFRSGLRAPVNRGEEEMHRGTSLRNIIIADRDTQQSINRVTGEYHSRAPKVGEDPLLDYDEKSTATKDRPNNLCGHLVDR